MKDFPQFETYSTKIPSLSQISHILEKIQKQVPLSHLRNKPEKNKTLVLSFIEIENFTL